MPGDYRITPDYLGRRKRFPITTRRSRRDKMGLGQLAATVQGAFTTQVGHRRPAWCGSATRLFARALRPILDRTCLKALTFETGSTSYLKKRSLRWPNFERTAGQKPRWIFKAIPQKRPFRPTRSALEWCLLCASKSLLCNLSIAILIRLRNGGEAWTPLIRYLNRAVGRLSQVYANLRNKGRAEAGRPLRLLLKRFGETTSQEFEEW